MDKDQTSTSDEKVGPRPVNKFKLTVLANAVCVDILVWATKDENGEFNYNLLS